MDGVDKFPEARTTERAARPRQRYFARVNKFPQTRPRAVNNRGITGEVLGNKRGG